MVQVQLHAVLLLAAISASLIGSSLASAECFEDGVDYFGSDLPGGLVRNVFSSDACQKLCQERRDCEFFAWATEEDESYGFCWLKSGSYTRMDNRNRISGPAKCSSRCTEDGIDYFGSDLPDGLVRNVYSAKACQKLCQKRKDCEFFAWATEADTNYGFCWLKSGSFSRRASKNRISGPAVCASSCSEDGIDYYGSDLPGGLVKNVNSADACQKLCQKRKDCEFFAWASKNDEGCENCRHNCWLKSGAFSRRDNENRISGPAKCSRACLEDGVDYFGSDLPDGLVRNVYSVKACQRLCQNRNDCEFFAWATEGDRNFGFCWLKSGSFSRRASKNRISGPAVCASSCSEDGIDYYGSDLPGGLVKNTNSADACQKLCQKRLDCEFFAWATKDDTNYGFCWLKSGSYTRMENRNRISGPAKCRLTAG